MSNYENMGAGGWCPPPPKVTRVILCIAVFFYFFLHVMIGLADQDNCDHCDMMAAGGGITGICCVLTCVLILLNAGSRGQAWRYTLIAFHHLMLIGIALHVIGRIMWMDDKWDYKKCGLDIGGDDDQQGACRCTYVGALVGEGLFAVATFLMGYNGVDVKPCKPPPPAVTRSLLLTSVFFYCLFAVCVWYYSTDRDDSFVKLVATGSCVLALTSVILLVMLCIGVTGRAKTVAKVLVAFMVIGITLTFIGRCMELDDVWDYLGHVDGGDRSRASRLGLVIGEFLWFVTAMLFCLGDAFR
eukprot:TRINITY_DN44915_c0_g1_i1.p2 TRINITY_DN44915_c0_g1~~TRINITY_DN44915_c0_g1_i1.p2  ORF type:complete len:299 (+),score=48.55 TRINITY_DN44915_c0_g1_i1:69-965(+)